MFKIRKYLAERLFELAFIILPKFESANYLYDKVDYLNVKYMKVKVANADGSELTA